MKSIDEIIDMLSEESDIEIQKLGIKLGKKVKNFNAFIQPCISKYSYLSWENCAEIICSKTTEELIPYLNELFWWVQDINYPGAYKIEAKLKEMKSNDIVLKKLEKQIKIIQNFEREEMFLENLLEIRNS